ncbi:MAG: EamA family transporter [Planctomycetota bacterium]
MLPLVAASLLWSLSFALIGKIGLDPDTLTVIRLGLAALAFAPLARGRGRGAGSTGRLAAIGGVQFGLMYVLVHRSYAYLAPHEVALLTITTPIFVVLIAALRERRVAARALLGAVVAVGAALVLRSKGAASDADARFWIGFALVQGANAAFAFGQVVYGRLRRGRSARAAAEDFAWMYMGAFTVAGAVALFTVDPSSLSLTGEQALTVLYLGLVPSGLAFYLWNLGATRVRAGVLAVMNNLKIPLAVGVALLPPFDGWRTLDSAGAWRLAASSALLGAALLIARGQGRVAA